MQLAIQILTCNIQYEKDEANYINQDNNGTLYVILRHVIMKKGDGKIIKMTSNLIIDFATNFT